LEERKERPRSAVILLLIKVAKSSICMKRYNFEHGGRQSMFLFVKDLGSSH
jgi:hypothetical protein